jgi:hypothetical protein
MADLVVETMESSVLTGLTESSSNGVLTPVFRSGAETNAPRELEQYAEQTKPTKYFFTVSFS